MENLSVLVNNFKNGNKDLISKTIESSRLYVTMLARSIVDNDSDAIKLAEDVYDELIFNASRLENVDSFTNYVNDLVMQKSQAYVKNKSLKPINKENDEYNLSKINIDDFKDYYNNPKVEKAIFDTINSLPVEEKEIVTKVYFSNYSISEIATKYNISEETVNSYLARANKAIDDKSKKYFIKYKVDSVNYNRLEIIYSVIQLGINICNKDVISIVVDTTTNAIDNIGEEKGEEKKEDLKDFVKSILEDQVKGWFVDRFKSMLVFASASSATGTIAAETVKTAAIKTTKAVGTSIVKKVIVGTLVTGVATTGGYTAYKVIDNKNQAELLKQKQADYSINTGDDLGIDIYKDEETGEIKDFAVDATVSKKRIKSGLLTTAEVVTAAIPGLNITHEENEDEYIIHVIVDKTKINKELINNFVKLGIINKKTADEYIGLLDCDNEQLLEYLNKLGFDYSTNNE